MKFSSEDLERVSSTTTKTVFGCGNFYNTLDELDDMVCRAFLKLGKAGGCQRCLLETIARLLTIILQDTDIPLERVHKTMCGMSCDQGTFHNKSCIDKLAKELKKYLPKESGNGGKSVPV
jgi:hypothetical protein